VPRQWWPDIESANAVIESDGPWPSSSPESNGRFVPLDVDRHEGFAVVVGFGQTDTGQWDRRGGGGSEGRDLGERESLVAGREALHLRVSGDTGWSAFETRPEFEFAAFLCGPDVATVEIRRHRGVRTADVRVGPGWLSVVWAKDDPVQVLAFSAHGTQSFSWTPPSKAA
jgi:hypothetical protein